MQSTYKVGRIAPEQVDPAYLLISPVAPTLDLAAWRTFCGAVQRKDRHDGEDDVAVATNPRGYLQGLCAYAVRQHPFYGRILDVSIFIVTSAADEAGVAADLLRHLKVLARAEACGAIRIWTLGEDTWSRHVEGAEVSRTDHGLVLLLDPNAPMEA